MGLSGNNGYIGNSQAYSFWGMLRQSQSIVPLQNPQGGHVGYANVTETLGANGEGGSISRFYKVTAIGTDSLSSRLDISAYTAYGQLLGNYGPVTNVLSGYGLYGNNHFNDTTAWPAIKPQNLAYNAGYNAANFFPLAPNQIDFQRGKLLSEQTYDSSGNLLVSISNAYNHIYHQNALIRGVKCFISTTSYGTNNIQWYALTYYKLHPGVSHLISTTKKTYAVTNFVSEVTTYGYESPYHTLRTSDTTTDSQGSTLINKAYYSLDYSQSTTTDNIFGKMKARNLLEPVRTDNWKNGNLIGEKVTKFYDFAALILNPDTLINPINVYSLETAVPLTPAQSGESTTWSYQNTLLPNSNLISKVNFAVDGTTGRMTGQQLTADKWQGIQWSSNLKLPVAIVDNAMNTATTTITQQQTTASTGTYLPVGSTSTYNAPFISNRTGSVILSLGFSGNPGTNPVAQVTCTVTGPNSYSTTVPLCIAAGTGNCSGTGSTYTLTNLPAGTYNVAAKFYQTQNVTSGINVNVSYPTLTNVTNTTGTKEFYYEGFEESTASGVTTGTAHTGTKFIASPYTVNWTLPNTRSYVISYWYLSGGIWTLQPEQPFTGNLTLAGGTGYDDIRIHPVDAFMTNYTYDANGNITSSTDAKGLTVYYEYDAFLRLVNVKDKDGNIVKHTDYHY